MLIVVDGRLSTLSWRPACSEAVVEIYGSGRSDCGNGMPKNGHRLAPRRDCRWRRCAGWKSV